METMLNACFDTFQKLSMCKDTKREANLNQNNNNCGSSGCFGAVKQPGAVIADHSVARRWNIFLKFLSTFYSKVS